MGCGNTKSKKEGPEEIYCSFHKKKLAEVLCLLPDCPTCKPDKFSLCSDCYRAHTLKMSDPNDYKTNSFIQPLYHFNLKKIAFYKFQIDESNTVLLKYVEALENLLKQQKKCQITTADFLKSLYVPFQELVKFSIKLKEEEKNHDYEMFNSLGIFIGSINAGEKVLDEASCIKRYYYQFDNSIRNSKTKNIGYLFDTGSIVNELNKRIGFVEFDKNGALVKNEKEVIIGKISNEGEVKDPNDKVLGKCKGHKIKVAYEFFFGDK